MRITINPDKNIVKEVTEALKECEGYCPCKLIKNPNTKCMCKQFREQTTPGPCDCGLYIKEN